MNILHIMSYLDSQLLKIRSTEKSKKTNPRRQTQNVVKILIEKKDLIIKTKNIRMICLFLRKNNI